MSEEEYSKLVMRERLTRVIDALRQCDMLDEVDEVERHNIMKSLYRMKKKCDDLGLKG